MVSELTVFIPSIDGLETVHHRSIETIGGRDQNDGTEKEVKLSELWELGPGDERKLTSTEDVGCWNSTTSTHFELS